MSTQDTDLPTPSTMPVSEAALPVREVMPETDALVEALRAERWGVLESWWARSGIAMLRAHPKITRAVYSGIPATVGGARHPGLEFARIYVRIGATQDENLAYFQLIHQLMHAARLHGTRWRSLLDPDVMLLTVTYRIHALRHVGAHHSAQDLIGEAAREVHARTDRGEQFTGPRMVEFHLACAMAAFHRGEWAETSRMLNQALWEHDPDAANAGPQLPIMAHSLYAMVNAVLGSVASARPHVDAARTVARQRQTFPEYLLLGSTVAERLGALDVLDEERSAALEPSGTVMEGTDYWAAAMVGCYTHDLLYSAPEATLTRIDFFTRLRHLPRTCTASKPSVSELIWVRARTEALIAGGKLQLAREVCREHPGFGLDGPDALLHLIAGRAMDALRIAENALQDPSRTARERGSLAAIAAAACERVGDAAAAAWSERTMAYCQEAESVLPIAMLPAADRALLLGRITDHAAWEIIARAHDTSAVVLLGRVRSLRSVYPEHGVLVDLTAREHQVLHALARTGSQTDLAETFAVSVSAIRNQVSALYRKLGVSTRAHALHAAAGLGLLSVPRGESVGGDLLQAVTRRSWTEVDALLNAGFFRYLFEVPGDLLHAYEVLPSEFFELHPRHVMSRGIALASTSRTSVVSADVQRQFRTWVESQEHPAARDVFGVRVAEMREKLTLGRYDEASEIADALLVQITSHPHEDDDLDDVAPPTLIRCGIVKLAVGRAEEAARCFREAVQWATVRGEHPIARYAREHLALACALLGRNRQAVELLGDDSEPLAEVGSPHFPYQFAGTLARAFVSVNALDVTLADSRIEALEAPDHYGELGWLVVHVRARAAWWAGSRWQMIQEIKSYLLHHASQADRATSPGITLRGDLASLYQADGKLHEAAAVLQTVRTCDHPALVEPRVQQQLLLGHPDRALALLDREAPDGSPPVAPIQSTPWGALLHVMVEHVSRGTADDDSIRAATTAMNHDRMHFPLLRVPPELRELIEPLLDVALERLPVVFPSRPAVRLTGRERDILQALAGPGSAEQIAAALHISLNTVRTHTRTLYRKLGARSRKEAVWLGRRFLR